MHERELFGGRVGAGSLGGEPVMRAERVRSVRSSAVAAAEGPFERRSCRSCRSSGHGLQQSPGAGRAIAELITTGDYQTVDVSCFGFERVLRDEPLYEQSIV